VTTTEIPEPATTAIETCQAPDVVLSLDRHSVEEVAGKGGQCSPCTKTADCGPKLQCYGGLCKKFKSDKCK
jgi:hypothetical protein